MRRKNVITILFKPVSVCMFQKWQMAWSFRHLSYNIHINYILWHKLTGCGEHLFLLLHYMKFVWILWNVIKFLCWYMFTYMYSCTWHALQCHWNKLFISSCLMDCFMIHNIWFFFRDFCRCGHNNSLKLYHNQMNNNGTLMVQTLIYIDIYV